MKETRFSSDRMYRYTLWREWYGGMGYVNFIGLNPSTADETADDPTIRRCIGYAKLWGYSGLCMTNLFAFRATDPKKMMAASDAIGPENNDYLMTAAIGADMIVAAWGAHGAWMSRGECVHKGLPTMYVLRLTKNGHPSHPLYLPKRLLPFYWKP